MELYGNTQLDKTAGYSEHVQYEAPATGLGRSPVTKFGGVSPGNLAWSAIIHRPAEDSEPDDLPSTVDMDAIKEPPTPMPPPMLTPKPEPPEPQSPAESSSGSDSEADSSSDSGGESNTDSEEGSGSNSCSWSESESGCSERENKQQTTTQQPRSAALGATRASSRSSHSSQSQRSQTDSDHSTHNAKQFSIRETNFDQGGLKLKISALKIPKKPVPMEESSSSSSSSERDNSSSDEEADKSSDASQGSRTPVRKHAPDPSHGNHTPVRKHLSEPEQQPARVLRENKIKETPTKDEESKKRVTIVETKTDTKLPKTPEDKTTKVVNNVKLVKEEARAAVRGSARLESLRSESKNLKSPVKVNNRTSELSKSGQVKTVSPVKNVEKTSPSVKANTSRLRSYRRKPARGQQEKTPTKVIRRGAADSCSSDDDEDEDTDGRETEDGQGGGDDISQLAHQLGEPETSIPISEQLQVINQEDLAAILPDVVGVFDGFEDVSSGEGRGAGTGNKAGAVARPGGPGPGQESSSDTELMPEQAHIVSEAIKRIDLDSESAGHDEEKRQSSSGEDDDDQEEQVGYRSSLLQQFVQKTEQLSQTKVQKVGGTQSTIEETGTARRRRGRPPKSNAPSVPQPANEPNRLVMPELEAYMRLDCSVSNVSPDSGIQSVAGSPSHQCSPSPAWHPPAHSPAQHEHHAHSHPNNNPPAPADKPKPHAEKISKLYATTADLLGEIGGKRGPGRPKGSSRRKRRKIINPELLLMKKDELQSARDMIKVPPFYRHPHHKTVVNMVERNDELPRLPGMMSGKRGPGRPKKTPPTLEPILPLSSGKCKKLSLGQNGKGKDERLGFPMKHEPHLKSGGSLLNDICERVSKRLDIPLSKVPKSIYERSGPSGYMNPKLGASLEKRKKGRRKFIQSRSLAVSKGLMKMRQHKHKKRKKLKKAVEQIDPKFVMDLEKLVQDFNKMCRINTEMSMAKSTETPPWPSIFKLKRIGKKRKGSERDRDSGPEAEASKEKTPTHNGSTGSTNTPSVVKRRPKKSTVETTKVNV